MKFLDETLPIRYMEPVYSDHPSGPNQLAAIQRWPDYTVEPVYSGHPSGPNQLAAIQRWPDYTVKPVYSGHPSGPNQLATIHMICVHSDHNLLSADLTDCCSSKTLQRPL